MTIAAMRTAAPVNAMTTAVPPPPDEFVLLLLVLASAASLGRGLAAAALAADR
jgi:hypothetical protein